MCLDDLQEALGETKRATARARLKAARCSQRKRPTGIVKELRQRLVFDALRPRRNFRCNNGPVEAPSRLWPRPPRLIRNISVGVIDAWPCQATSDPFEYWDTDRVADEPPARAVSLATIRDGRRGAAGREALQALCIPNVRRNDQSARKNNPGRRRNTDRRSSLERRNHINSPPEASNTFGPVKTTRGTVQGRLRFASQ